MKYIAVHCSDTPDGSPFDIDDIRYWHVTENGWSDVGYHFVILLDGTIQLGRPLGKKGAHVKGYNKNSIGVCYIGGGGGEDTRTVEQKSSLAFLIATLKRIYPKAVVKGHRDFPGVTKKCPCFDAETEYKNI